MRLDRACSMIACSFMLDHAIQKTLNPLKPIVGAQCHSARAARSTAAVAPPLRIRRILSRRRACQRLHCTAAIHSSSWRVRCDEEMRSPSASAAPSPIASASRNFNEQWTCIAADALRPTTCMLRQRISHEINLVPTKEIFVCNFLENFFS